MHYGLSIRSAVSGPICVAILRCSVAALLGVALLRLRCSLLSRRVWLATRPSTHARAAPARWLFRRPHLHDGPHLDRAADTNGRNARRDRDRLVEILRVDEVVAGELLLRLGERA